MTTRLPKTAMSLKQFLVRQQVLSLYREILKTINKVPDKSVKLELKEWAKTDFKNNKHHTDEAVIKSLVMQGRKSLNDLKNSLSLSAN